MTKELRIWRYLLEVEGENATSADNQQERLGWYIAGYVDGEGSFHVALQRNNSCRVGFQLVPEFHVSQSGERGAFLETIRETLACGYIKENHACNPRDSSLVYVVKRRKDLVSKVLPFFSQYQLLSSKQREFKVFAQIVNEMEYGKHLQVTGFVELAKLALSMNGAGRYRKQPWADRISNLESSETIRQTFLKRD